MKFSKLQKQFFNPTSHPFPLGMWPLWSIWKYQCLSTPFCLPEEMVWGEGGAEGMCQPGGNLEWSRQGAMGTRVLLHSVELQEVWHGS